MRGGWCGVVECSGCSRSPDWVARLMRPLMGQVWDSASLDLHFLLSPSDRSDLAGNLEVVEDSDTTTR